MKTIKKIIRNFVIKHIYQITTSANYILVKEQDVFMDNKPVDRRTRQILRFEATFIKESLLYKSIRDNRNYIAQQELLRHGEGYIDAVKASYLITLEDMRLIETLANLPLDSNK